MEEKMIYEAPVLEVTEFELTDSIAVSGKGLFGTIGNEEFWGN